jgi:hypothetical protein
MTGRRYRAEVRKTLLADLAPHYTLQWAAAHGNMTLCWGPEEGQTWVDGLPTDPSDRMDPVIDDFDGIVKLATKFSTNMDLYVQDWHGNRVCDVREVARGN